MIIPLFQLQPLLQALLQHPAAVIISVAVVLPQAPLAVNAKHQLHALMAVLFVLHLAAHHHPRPLLAAAGANLIAFQAISYALVPIGSAWNKRFLRAE